MDSDLTTPNPFPNPQPPTPNPDNHQSEPIGMTHWLSHELLAVAANLYSHLALRPLRLKLLWNR
jgi:hypothetical protein